MNFFIQNLCFFNSLLFTILKIYLDFLKRLETTDF